MKWRDTARWSTNQYAADASGSSADSENESAVVNRVEDKISGLADDKRTREFCLERSAHGPRSGLVAISLRDNCTCEVAVLVGCYVSKGNREVGDRGIAGHKIGRGIEGDAGELLCECWSRCLGGVERA